MSDEGINLLNKGKGELTLTFGIHWVKLGYSRSMGQHRASQGKDSGRG